MSMNKTPMTRRCTRAADRDLAEQLRAIGHSLSQHRQDLDALLPDMAAGDPGAVPAGHCELFDPDALTERKRAARRAGENLVLLELERAETLGVVRSLASMPNRRKLEALRRDYPHFGAVVDLIEMRCALARLSLGRALSMPPLLLSGPPGVGKTAFADASADCLGLPLRRVDIASSTAGFVIAGSHSSWAASRPGVVWSLLQSKMAAGVLMLDEIDKAG